MLDTPEQELIERAQEGNADAVATLYRRYVPAIARYIGYRISDPAAVEDLTAEVFLRMVEGLPRYQITGAPFEAWLYRIAGARVVDYYRQLRPAQELNETLDGNSPPLDLNLQQQEELAELRQALSQLSDEQQTILVLRFVERKSHEEVAQVLGKSIDAIATAQHRALKRLAELMGTEKSSRHYLRGRLR
jgi:RNA polymerase sigma-70 factor (ECF subfamily)